MNNKPTKSGYYWMRQNWRNTVTNTIERANPETVWVVNGSIRRKTGLLVIGMGAGGWREMLDNAPDYWEWSDEITSPI